MFAIGHDAQLLAWEVGIRAEVRVSFMYII